MTSEHNEPSRPFNSQHCCHGEPDHTPKPLYGSLGEESARTEETRLIDIAGELLAQETHSVMKKVVEKLVFSLAASNYAKALQTAGLHDDNAIKAEVLRVIRGNLRD